MTHTAPSADDQRVAAALQDGAARVLDAWEQLHASGPLGDAGVLEDRAGVRAGYLEPLLRMLVGALRGSPSHEAVYLDERMRFWDRTGSSERLAGALEQEADVLAHALAPHVAEQAVRDVWAQTHLPLLEQAAGGPRVLFVGDCLFTETRAFLTARARRAARPVLAEHVYFSAGLGVTAEGGAVTEQVRAFGPDLVGLSLFTFEGVPPWSAAWTAAASPLGARGTDRLVEGLVDLVARALDDIRIASDCTVVVHAPGGLQLHRSRKRPSVLPPNTRAQQRLVAALGDGLSALVGSTVNTVLLDERELVAAHGGPRDLERSVFAVDDVRPGYAHTRRVGEVLAERYDRLVSDVALLGRAKALLVDFDGTLWRGVVGEGAVEHDVAGQTLLKELEEAGVLLVALSKNDASAVRWDEMVLQPDDFVLHKINWLPKPDNVTAAVAELDLAASAFVLLDDNPVERALVTEQVPGVRALDPTEPATWQTLRTWLEMPSTSTTEEARRRTTMYREAAARRQALTGGHDYGAMMGTLALRYGVRRATAEDMPRLLELVQRTNQFNTTTRRRSRAELAELLEDPSYALHVATLGDRFGDLGIVALVVLHVPDRTFDSVIMSCRAMGFGLETALLHDVIAAHPGGTVTGLFVPSDRNRPAADLYRRVGFDDRGDGTWTSPDDPAAGPQVPDWFTRQG